MPFRQQFPLLRMHVLFLQVLDEVAVQTLQTNGTVPQNFRHVIAGMVDIGIAEHQKSTCWRTMDQIQHRLEDRDAGAFRTDQGPGDIKPPFG